MFQQARHSFKGNSKCYFEKLLRVMSLILFIDRNVWGKLIYISVCVCLFYWRYDGFHNLLDDK